LKVLLVDDQALFREGLRVLLSAQPGVEVVGECANGEEALRAYAALRPDVVLMDLRMPVLDGVAATRRLCRADPSCRVLALTTFDDDQTIFEALRAGARGYLLKDSPVALVVDALRAAAQGDAYLPPSVARTVIEELQRLSHDGDRARGASLGLSEREAEVLRHLARGASNKEIATALRIAEGTVKNHLTSVFEKLGVDDRLQAAMRARELGLL
jgi:DNA-binding NarL/FixJ family response regulator